MKTKSLVAAAFGALTLALAITAVEAAPAMGVGNAIRTAAGDAGQIEKVTYGYAWHRHCYWQWGYRHCHWRDRHWGGHHYSGYRRWGHYDRWGHHHWWGPRHSSRYGSGY